MQSVRVVATQGGRVRGISHNGVQRYLGIRYGEAPVGDRRWQVAAPAAWAGVADATAYGPAAPQLDTRLSAGGLMPAVLDLLYPRGGSPAENGAIGEDCLRLNVWAPEDADGLPVMVWLHGGGFVHGAGSEQVFAGDVLARTGRVVVVSINHRLGMLGFLELEHLLGDRWRRSGNVGLTDILLALRWVAANIGSFGGDPARVTIFGQSGGGAKVAAMTAVSEAAGLFGGAVIQSGPVRWTGDPESARATTAAVLEAANIPEHDAELLFELPLRQLLYLQQAADASGLGWRPYVDGDLLPAAPYSGPDRSAAVPLLVGYTAHDFSLFLCERDDYASLDRDAVLAFLRGTHGERAETVLRECESAHPGLPPQLHLARVLTEETMARSTHIALRDAAACGARVYGYRFDYVTEAANGLLGATHSSDLAFVFGTVDRIPLSGYRPERFAVSQAMSDAWIRFAETRDPGGGVLGTWPAHSAEEGWLMSISDRSEMVAVSYDLDAPSSAPAFWPDNG